MHSLGNSPEFPGIPFFALWVKRNQFLFAEERFEKAGQTAKEPPKTGSFLRGTRYLLAKLANHHHLRTNQYPSSIPYHKDGICDSEEEEEADDA